MSHTRNPCTRQLVKLDGFGQGFSFVLPDNSTKLRTVPGAICWLVMACLMLTYTAYQFSYVVTQNKYKTNLETYDYHFD